MKPAAAAPTAQNWRPGNEAGVFTITSTDGYFIAFKNRKYRLFSPQRAMIGVYDDEQEAKRKAAAHARKTKP